MESPTDTPKLPLSGRSVVVCRADSQSATLVASLAELGADVQRLPLIRVDSPLDQGASLAVAAAQLSEFAWVLFTSANAARALLDCRGARPWPAGTKVGAIGPATAKVLKDQGVHVALMPTIATAAELARVVRTELDKHGVVTARILAPLGELAGPDLVSGLAIEGLQVDAPVAYRTTVPTHSDIEYQRAATADFILLTSPSTVDRLVEVLPQSLTAGLICIGPRTAAAAKSHGLDVLAIANPHSEAGLIGATVNSIGS